ncbi:MAG: cytochrome P450, partial [Pseudomonadota bacterium]
HVVPRADRPPLLTWLQGVRQNMLTLIPEAAYHQPIVTERLGPLRWHVLGAPAAYRHVFHERRENYPKAPLMRRMLAPYLGDSIFMAEGAEWSLQRETLGPVFRQSALKSMGIAMQRVAESTSKRLTGLADTGEQTAMSFQMRVLSMDMIRHTMFADLADSLSEQDGPVDPDQLERYRATRQGDLDAYLQTIARPGLADLLQLPDWAVPGRWFRRTPVREARDLLLALIRDRRACNRTGNDMLGLLLALRDDQGRPQLSEAQIRDTLMTFIVAGSDTTAVALTWAIYILSQRPDHAQALRAEADVALANAEGAEAVAQLPKTRAFFEEVLRLFPPAALLIRRAREADRIEGADIRAGDTVFCPIYALHRRADLWSDPLRFEPARFEARAGREGFSYLPFGAGARVCIGTGFAMMEACLTLAVLARDFDFTLAPGWPVKPLMILTLKPDGGLPILLSKRNLQGDALHAA